MNMHKQLASRLTGRTNVCKMSSGLGLSRKHSSALEKARPPVCRAASIRALKCDQLDHAYYNKGVLTMFPNGAEVVRWVCGSLQPASIVEAYEDFKIPMKAGGPNYQLPPRTNISRDIRSMFKKRLYTRCEASEGISGNILISGRARILPKHTGPSREVELHHRPLDIPQSPCTCSFCHPT